MRNKEKYIVSSTLGTKNQSDLQKNPLAQQQAFERWQALIKLKITAPFQEKQNANLEKVEFNQIQTNENKVAKKKTFHQSQTNAKNMLGFIKYPTRTYKTYLGLVKEGQYTFEVDLRLTKTQIKTLFEQLFNVNVISVNTLIPPRQKLRVGVAVGNSPQYKKTIITLKKGQSLDYTLSEK